MDSVRLTALKDLTALLETITVANGYQHDLAGAVYRGRNRFDVKDPLPRLAILEAPTRGNTDSPEQSNLTRERWELYIQGWVPEDFSNPTDPAHLLLADVKKCLAQIRERGNQYAALGNTLHDLNISGGICRPADESSTETYFLLVLTCLFVEDTLDPYS